MANKTTSVARNTGLSGRHAGHIFQAQDAVLGDIAGRRGRGAKGKDATACHHRSVLSAALVTLFCTFDGFGIASAQSVTGLGQVGPGTVQSPEWIVGDDLVVGDTADGTLTITAGGTVSNLSAYIGNYAGSNGTVVVSGADGSGAASRWTSSGQVNIGVEVGGNGTVRILDGGVADSSQSVLLGLDSTSVGNITVSGSASTWTISRTASLYIGDLGTGTVQIDDGGAVRSGQGLIGVSGGGNGRVTVSGPASIWDTVANIYAGFEGTGELEVLDGATVSTVGSAGPTSAASVYIGYGTGGSGTVTVSSSTGDISTLTATDRVEVGRNGAGTLTIERGGLVRAESNTHIAIFSGSTGTLDLNGDASGRGVLETGSVVHGEGTAALNIDGGILRALRNQSDYLNGFATQAVGAEGAWFDTDSYDVVINTGFSGTSSFNKLGGGILTLTGDSSAFTGNTEIQAGTLQVDGIVGGPTTVWAGARLTGTGQVGPTVNRGTIAPGPRSGFGTLTIAGDYAASGGNLAIRTRLGDDSSPTDRLVITGATSGVTPVTVTNVGGEGAPTQHGIQIVQVNGASDGRFDLANGDYVIGGQPALVAGAYGYVLEKDAADGDWYLRSSLTNPGSPDPDGATPPGGVTPPDGGSAAPGGSSAPPLYQPGVPVYEAYANTLMSLSQLPTLRQRVGNRLYDPRGAGRNGVWARVEGTTARLEPSVSTTGSRQDIDSWKAQFGVDRILSGEQGGSRLVGGFTVHYGTADTHVSSGHGNGRVDTTAYGLGPTLTWYGKDGAYVDAQAQATWFDSDLSSGLAGRLANGKSAHSYGLSLEAGKAYAVKEGFSLIPQAQLSYVSTRFNRFDDRFGAQVESDKGDSLQGRLGVALDYTRSWDDGGGKTREASIYGVVNVKHEFLDGARVQVAGVPVESRMGRTWGGVGVGGNYSWGERYALYGEVGTDADFSGSYAVTATAGFRMMF
ncbi:autotransporter family protein [Bordetella genomosp. 13]|uniref:Autotransporter outer membrane beta-barrel domain-containing protein n=1 Tax=Bordetella genomosp. 13 TaxID=463040 RepID=A0A1W6Z774_9BORD|nr:autotransporter outer membrane beta-barrel domain-containing protein [Bordetella genomosp. 13]ARP93276.1 autotransporter outer membrane beta-barrel domain-containing protein [Bordetella genomosp. 13]